MLTNRALWVLLSAIALYWGLVLAVGPDRSRDAIDWIAIFTGLCLLFVIGPHAVDRFRRGGGRAEWQIIIGVTLLVLHTVVIAGWSYAVRYYDRPQWMIDSPLNGFWRFMLLGADLLLLSVVAGSPIETRRSSLYWTIVAFACGLIVGVAGLRYIGAIEI